ncbi:MAG: MTH938/NDUFAF3 family protein [Gammaproteobacteria bacterium]|nr:MTH938/NDUFAF3 family protein [Gammaproteobacteria bacterium]
MHFTEDKPSGNYIINEYSKNTVTINNQCYENSLYLSADTFIEQIPLRRSSDLSIKAIEFIFDMKPELVILGSGESLKFPPAEIIAHFAHNGIGFETMDHSAACRTYAVLSAEQRDVGLLILID